LPKELVVVTPVTPGVRRYGVTNNSKMIVEQIMIVATAYVDIRTTSMLEDYSANLSSVERM
jgi:hypothetical protein